PPDLLITRIYVEGMPGHQAATYLRTKRPHMRVLIMSGMLDDERLVDRAALEGFEVFPRPYTAAEFLGKVKEVMGKPRSAWRPRWYRYLFCCDRDLGQYWICSVPLSRACYSAHCS